MGGDIPDHTIKIVRHADARDFYDSPPQLGDQLSLTGTYVDDSVQASERGHSFLLEVQRLQDHIKVRYVQAMDYSTSDRLHVEGTWEIKQPSEWIRHTRQVISDGDLQLLQEDIIRSRNDPRNHYIEATLVEKLTR